MRLNNKIKLILEKFNKINIYKYMHSNIERARKTVKIFDDLESDKPKVIFAKK